MFLGHFGVALAAKKAAPKASLGVLVLAAQLAELLWPIFLLLGWEQVRIVPGITRVNPLEFTSFPYSHSLVAQLFWGIALGVEDFASRRDARSALLAAALVPSQWILHYITHRPDLPIVPGGERYGLGMWNSLPLTLIVEFALFRAGIAVYLSTTSAKDRAGQYALWSLLIFLILSLSRLDFWTATTECPCPCARRIGNLARHSVGGVGRPASIAGLRLAPDC